MLYNYILILPIYRAVSSPFASYNLALIVPYFVFFLFLDKEVFGVLLFCPGQSVN